MKILHVLNTGGVASIIAKFTDRIFATKSRVITRKIQDRFGLTIYGEYWNSSFYVFLLKIVWEARKHDIVQLHDRDLLITILKFIYPGKPVIIHYHGSKIRGKWKKRKKYWSKADKILVVTKDLLRGAPESVEVLENPVDTDLFYPMPKVKRELMKALHFEYGVSELARETANGCGLELVIVDRSKNYIPYLKMPEFLNRFEFYIDVKLGRRFADYNTGSVLLHPPDAYSKTGLEALACGLTVLSINKFIARGLPEENYPEFVADRMYEIYNELLLLKT